MIKNKNIYLTFFVLIISIDLLFCQEVAQGKVKQSIANNIVNFPSEQVILNTNKTVYIVGETLYYSSFIKNGKDFSDVSKMSYTFLVNPLKKILIKQKLRVKKGLSYGDFFIPSKLKTGNYKLISITLDSKNNELKNTGTKDILIINPFLKYSYKLTDSDTLIIKREIHREQKKIIKTYQTRSKIKLPLNEFGIVNKGKYLVSVSKIDSLSYFSIENNNIINTQKISNLPELRGELISGILLDSLNIPIVNKTVTLSITNNPNLYKNVETNKQGRFYFNLFDDYNSGSLVLNILDNKPINSYNIILDKKELSLKNKLHFKNVVLDKSIEFWLSKNSIYNQVENVYFGHKKDSIISIGVKTKFYDDISHHYLLADYTRFKTVKEIFTEIIFEAFERKKQGKHQFFVHFPNSINEYASKFKPLVLIDGIPINNHQVLYDYNPTQIKYIDVINNLYVYGPEFFGGVINVRTIKGDFIPKRSDVVLIQDFNKPFSNKVYYQPNYDLDFEKLSSIPDFRTQLYWNPKLNFEDKNITFFSSDVKGIYQIEVKGFTDLGEAIYQKKFIKVE